MEISRWLPEVYLEMVSIELVVYFYQDASSRGDAPGKEQLKRRTEADPVTGGGSAMKSREPMSKCIYIIDNLDRIISVSDNWQLFAQENQAGESCHPDNIINKSLWDFIYGDETKQFYEIILKTIRTKNKTVKLPFRCDAPKKRRYLELIITPVQQGNIEFTSNTIHEESRDTVEMLELGIPRSDELIKMCSMCKKVKLSENTWVEVEGAVVSLKLFEKNKVPQISHGICTECLKLGMSEIDKFFT